MITSIDDKEWIRSSWESVFVSKDPFSNPFRSPDFSLILFYGLEGYHLSHTQYQAILEAIAALNESEFLISHIEYEEDFILQGEHWLCSDPSTYTEYIKVPIYVENALYSQKGTWGAILSHEDHAVVGGSSQFVETVKEHYPQWEEDRRELFAYWEGNPNGAWLEAMSKDGST